MLLLSNWIYSTLNPIKIRCYFVSVMEYVSMQVVRNSIFVATLVNVEVFADADCTLIGLFSD